MTLHDRIHAAVTARQERAQVPHDAEPGTWGVRDTRNRPWVVDANGDWIAEVSSPRDATFIAAENPAFVLAQCTRDLKVLERHRPHPGDPTACWRCTRLADEHRKHPCDEVLHLADAYAISTEEDTNHDG